MLRYLHLIVGSILCRKFQDSKWERPRTGTSFLVPRGETWLGSVTHPRFARGEPGTCARCRQPLLSCAAVLHAGFCNMRSDANTALTNLRHEESLPAFSWLTPHGSRHGTRRYAVHNSMCSKVPKGMPFRDLHLLCAPIA
jgi:hypothetical protein